MGKEKRSISEETHPAGHISGNIMRYTKKDVKRKVYLSTTGRFHERFGKRWRKKR
jgi:hypothetical protein